MVQVFLEVTPEGPWFIIEAKYQQRWLSADRKWGAIEQWLRPKIRFIPD